MRSPKLLSIVVALVALVALAASGCGGGDDGATESTQATETTTALTKEELIAQGDALCGEVNAAIGALSVSETQVPDQITQVSDLYVGMIENIKDLGIPEDPAGYEEFIAAADEFATIEGEVKLAAEREDTTALGEAATAATPALEEFTSQARQYGFEDCGAGPTPPAASGEAAPTGEGEEGGVEVAPEELEEEAEAAPEEVAPEEVAPETGGAGGGVEEVAPESGGGETGGSSGGVGPG